MVKTNIKKKIVKKIVKKKTKVTKKYCVVLKKKKRKRKQKGGSNFNEKFAKEFEKRNIDKVYQNIDFQPEKEMFINHENAEKGSENITGSNGQEYEVWYTLSRNVKQKVTPQSVKVWADNFYKNTIEYEGRKIAKQLNKQGFTVDKSMKEIKDAYKDYSLILEQIINFAKKQEQEKEIEIAKTVNTSEKVAESQQPNIQNPQQPNIQKPLATGITPQQERLAKEAAAQKAEQERLAKESVAKKVAPTEVAPTEVVAAKKVATSQQPNIQKPQQPNIQKPLATGTTPQQERLAKEAAAKKVATPQPNIQKPNIQKPNIQKPNIQKPLSTANTANPSQSNDQISVFVNKTEETGNKEQTSSQTLLKLKNNFIQNGFVITDSRTKNEVTLNLRSLTDKLYKMKQKYWSLQWDRDINGHKKIIALIKGKLDNATYKIFAKFTYTGIKFKNKKKKEQKIPNSYEDFITDVWSMKDKTKASVIKEMDKTLNEIIILFLILGAMEITSESLVSLRNDLTMSDKKLEKHFQSMIDEMISVANTGKLPSTGTDPKKTQQKNDFEVGNDGLNFSILQKEQRKFSNILRSIKSIFNNLKINELFKKDLDLISINNIYYDTINSQKKIKDLEKAKKPNSKERNIFLSVARNIGKNTSEEDILKSIDEDIRKQDDSAASKFLTDDGNKIPNSNESYEKAVNINNKMSAFIEVFNKIIGIKKTIKDADLLIKNLQKFEKDIKGPDYNLFGTNIKAFVLKLISKLIPKLNADLSKKISMKTHITNYMKNADAQLESITALIEEKEKEKDEEVKIKIKKAKNLTYNEEGLMQVQLKEEKRIYKNDLREEIIENLIKILDKYLNKKLLVDSTKVDDVSVKEVLNQIHKARDLENAVVSGANIFIDLKVVISFLIKTLISDGKSKQSLILQYINDFINYIEKHQTKKELFAYVSRRKISLGRKGTIHDAYAELLVKELDDYISNDTISHRQDLGKLISDITNQLFSNISSTKKEYLNVYNNQMIRKIIQAWSENKQKIKDGAKIIKVLKRTIDFDDFVRSITEHINSIDNKVNYFNVEKFTAQKYFIITVITEILEGNEKQEFINLLWAKIWPLSEDNMINHPLKIMSVQRELFDGTDSFNSVYKRNNLRKELFNIAKVLGKDIVQGFIDASTNFRIFIKKILDLGVALPLGTEGEIETFNAIIRYFNTIVFGLLEFFGNDNLIEKKNIEKIVLDLINKINEEVKNRTTIVVEKGQLILKIIFAEKVKRDEEVISILTFLRDTKNLKKKIHTNFRTLLENILNLIALNSNDKKIERNLKIEEMMDHFVKYNDKQKLGIDMKNFDKYFTESASNIQQPPTNKDTIALQTTQPQQPPASNIQQPPTNKDTKKPSKIQKTKQPLQQPQQPSNIQGQSKDANILLANLEEKHKNFLFVNESELNNWISDNKAKNKFNDPRLKKKIAEIRVEIVIDSFYEIFDELDNYNNLVLENNDANEMKFFKYMALMDHKWRTKSQSNIIKNKLKDLDDLKNSDNIDVQLISRQGKQILNDFKTALNRLMQVKKDLESQLPQTGGKKSKKPKKILKKIVGKKIVRKHRGIIQIGGNIGRLKKGFKFSGKRLKSGMPEILKVKSKK